MTGLRNCWLEWRLARCGPSMCRLLLVTMVLFGVATSASAAAQQPDLPPVHVTLTTANLRRALSDMPPLRFGAKRPRLPLIRVDDAVRYQRMIGLGAAMTDSSAWLLYDELTPDERARVMQALFGRTGIRLDFVHIPMGASDFTANGVPYTYDDMPTGQTDPLLQNFSLAHDAGYIIPALQMMLRINPRIWTLANPWTAPPWMKTNGGYDNSFNGGVLLPEDYEPYAHYFVRFIQGYAGAGIPIDAITPENEPVAPSPFPAMQLDEPAEATLITQYLTPALAAAGVHTQIYGLDSGRILPYAQELVAGPARAALGGIAWHCYGGLDVMSALHREFPALSQIVSECSPGIIPHAAVEVAIDATRNWASAVQLWNLALDPAGGPVEPENWGCRGCKGLLMISEQTHQATFLLPYYQFGQMSRFVQPGATRIASTRFVSDYEAETPAYGITPGLDNVAFLNPDHTRVVVVYNNSMTQRAFAIAWRGTYVRYTLAARATATFEWRAMSHSA